MLMERIKSENGKFSTLFPFCGKSVGVEIDFKDTLKAFDYFKNKQ